MAKTGAERQAGYRARRAEVALRQLDLGSRLRVVEQRLDALEHYAPPTQIVGQPAVAPFLGVDQGGQA